MSELDGKDALARRQSLFNNPSMSDLILHYDDKKLFAHKAIMSLSSPYFTKLYSTGSKEANEAELHLEEEMSGKAFYGMICHIYGVDIPDCGFMEDDMHFWVELLRLSDPDQYHIPSLINFCEEKVEEELWQQLFDGDIRNGLRALYGSEGRHREVAAKFCRDGLSHFLEIEEGFVELLIDDIPALAVDILSSMTGWAAPESDKPEANKRKRIA